MSTITSQNRKLKTISSKTKENKNHLECITCCLSMLISIGLCLFNVVCASRVSICRIDLVNHLVSKMWGI